MPAGLAELRIANPIYKIFPGWKDLEKNDLKSYENIPYNLQNYIQYIELKINCPIKIISLGPKRHQIIIR